MTVIRIIRTLPTRMTNAFFFLPTPLASRFNTYKLACIFLPTQALLSLRRARAAEHRAFNNTIHQPAGLGVFVHTSIGIAWQQCTAMPARLGYRTARRSHSTQFTLCRAQRPTKIPLHVVACLMLVFRTTVRSVATIPGFFSNHTIVCTCLSILFLQLTAPK